VVFSTMIFTYQAETHTVTWVPRAPVTENPAVGSLGTGRVNRILGPDEESTGPLEQSLRQARRQTER
jgi:hypothetical protein